MRNQKEIVQKHTPKKGEGGPNSASGSRSYTGGPMQLTKLKSYLAKKLTRKIKGYLSPTPKDKGRMSPNSDCHPNNMTV